MKEDQKWVKLQLELQHGVKAEILITDNVAVMTSDKKGLMKQNYELERKLGNGRAGYDARHEAYVERYDGWSLEKIVKKVTKEVKGSIVTQEEGI